MSKNDEPAFVIEGGMGLPRSYGLTKREVFVKAAMQGLLANSESGSALSPEDLAHWSIRHADALLAELEKK